MARPPGIYAPIKTKKVYDPEELAEACAVAIVSGENFKTNPALGPVTEYDRRQLTRVTGETVEQFNDRLAQKLRVIADKTADRIEEKMDADAFKTSELGFILSVAHDKRLSLDGSRALNNSSVNLQVHFHGASPKNRLMEELEGLGSVKNVSPNQDVEIDSSATTPGNSEARPS